MSEENDISSLFHGHSYGEKLSGCFACRRVENVGSTRKVHDQS
jgi:hypothetical protein